MFNSLMEIVEQLRWCDYECEAGKLEDNVAFYELEQMATERTMADLMSPTQLYRAMMDEREAKKAPMYSHRNGETEPPTVDGWFWIKNPSPERFADPMEFVRVHFDDLLGDVRVFEMCIEGYEFGKEYHNYRWWGPVIPPWNE